MEEKKKIDWKKIGLNLLYPHIAVIICLLPVSIALLLLSFIYLSTKSILAILSYILSFYVLLDICFRVPNIVKFIKTFKLASFTKSIVESITQIIQSILSK